MSAKRSKRYNERQKLVDLNKAYTLEEGMDVLKNISDSKFDETVALNFQLGVRADSGSENVRGAVSLPNGSGKSVRVLCFAKGEAARAAEENGADFVGAEDLVEKIQGGWFEFDSIVAHPDMMREVSKLGRVLGPKGLMPTPKTGGVTPNVGKAVKELKAGKIEFKSDKTSGLHAICGKLSFSKEALIENTKTVIKAVKDAKPAASKGEYLKTVTLAPTQGPRIKLAVNTL